MRYVSTETFLNEYVDAIRTNTTANFKRRYRDIDVLLIDDIQFMEGKEGLQEEFFHTFNSLHGANKQIVISSDRMPDAIPTLEERLRGRFKWGLITDIQPPDLETRLAILRNKAERDHSPVPAETLEFIATQHHHQHPRARRRAHPGHRLRQPQPRPDHHPPRRAPARRPAHRHDVKPRTDDELLAEMAVILGYSVEALRGKSRQRPLVTARQIAMYVFRELTDLSYPAIARLFGGRDHTTVIHAVDKIQRLMKERKQIYDQVTDLVQRLEARHERSVHLCTVTWTTLWTRGSTSGTTVGRPPKHKRVISGLWTAGDNAGDAYRPLRWADAGLSTIHSPYYRYYL